MFNLPIHTLSTCPNRPLSISQPGQPCSQIPYRTIHPYTPNPRTNTFPQPPTNTLPRPVRLHNRSNLNLTMVLHLPQPGQTPLRFLIGPWAAPRPTACHIRARVVLHPAPVRYSSSNNNNNANNQPTPHYHRIRLPLMSRLSRLRLGRQLVWQREDGRADLIQWEGMTKMRVTRILVTGIR